MKKYTTRGDQKPNPIEKKTIQNFKITKTNIGWDITLFKVDSLQYVPITLDYFI